MFKKTAFLFFFLISLCGFSQQTKRLEYTIKAGETLYAISRKYGLTPYDILLENPDLQLDNLAIGTVIVIPLKRAGRAKAALQGLGAGADFFYHTLKKGETLASLKRLYGVSLRALKALNPDWAKGLAIGQRVKVPRVEPRSHTPLAAELPQPTDRPTPQICDGFDRYTVKPHETLYDLHQRFAVSIQDLKDWNGGLPEGLKAGMQIRIKHPKAPLSDRDEAYQRAAKPAPPAGQQPLERDTLSLISFTVQPNQTVFSILRQTNTTFEQLLRYNPALSDGLKAGMMLRVPSTEPPAALALDFDKSIVDFGYKRPLPNRIGSKTRLNVVLLAPFYTAELPDTIATSDSIPASDQLSKSRFATEFAIGARLALESLQQKGLHIDFSIYDTGRNMYDLQALLNANHFENADLVIGPFYTRLSELAAQSLERIPVVSPFSQRLNLYQHPNLIQVRPPEAFMAEEVLDLLLRESRPEDEIIVLCKPSPACEESVDYLRSKTLLPIEVMAQLPNDTMLAELPDNPTLDELKDRQLQVVFTDQNNPNYATSLSKLAQINAGFNIRAYFTHDVNYYQAMPVHDMIGLQITLPKATYYDHNSEAYKALEERFMDQYKMVPRVYELMGYDVTYDFLMRLSQYPDLFQSLQAQRAGDIQLHTDFKRLKNGGYFNSAVFLLRYGKDGFQPVAAPERMVSPVETSP